MRSYPGGIFFYGHTGNTRAHTWMVMCHPALPRNTYHPQETSPCYTVARGPHGCVGPPRQKTLQGDEKGSMTPQKSIHCFSFLLVLLLIGITGITCAGGLASESPATAPPVRTPIPVETRPVPDVGIIRWDPLIERESPHYMLLIVNDVGKAATLRSIDECYASGEEKAWMAGFIQNIWKTYPVITVKQGNTTMYSIERIAQGHGLTEEEKRGLEIVDREISRYLNDRSRALIDAPAPRSWFVVPDTLNNSVLCVIRSLNDYVIECAITL